MKNAFVSKFVSCLSFAVVAAIIMCFRNGVVGEKSYRLNLQKVVADTDESMMNFTNLRVYKYNRSVSALNGSVEIFKDLPETVLVELLGYEKIGNEYILSGIQFREDLLCSQILKYKEVIFFPGYNETTNFDLECPIEKGSYYIINYRPEHHALPDSVPGHYWRFDVKARFPDQIDKYIFLFQVFVEIERKVPEWNPMNG